MRKLFRRPSPAMIVACPAQVYVAAYGYAALVNTAPASIRRRRPFVHCWPYIVT